MSQAKSTKVVSLHAQRGSAPRAPPGQNVLGRVVGFSAGQGLLVNYEGNERGPLPALSVVALSTEEAQALALSGQSVLLTFEGGRPERPLVVGLVQPVPSPGLVARWWKAQAKRFSPGRRYLDGELVGGVAGQRGGALEALVLGGRPRHRAMAALWMAQDIPGVPLVETRAFATPIHALPGWGAGVKARQR